MNSTKFKRDMSESSRTGSSSSMIRRNGELFAVVHQGTNHSALKSSIGNSPSDSLSKETTYHTYYKKPVMIRGPNAEKKPLEPYSETSLRNRPLVKFENEPIPYTRHCAQRNEHQFQIKYGRSSDTERTRFKTTNRSTFVDHGANGPPIGFYNEGIASEKTKWFKKRLQD